jgi:hypothetical protein
MLYTPYAIKLFDRLTALARIDTRFAATCQGGSVLYSQNQQRACIIGLHLLVQTKPIAHRQFSRLAATALPHP